MNRETNFGIIDIAIQLPSCYVDQKDLAQYLGVEEGKLIQGLGLMEAGVCDVNEDPVSLALSAVKKLMDKHSIKPYEIGRLEVGTESNWDTSKSFKTYLMELLKTNKNIGGCDSLNACYGGTNALFNAIHWMESSFYDGKYAIVVCTDMAIYKDQKYIPLSGSACCAILLGKNPVLKFRLDMVSHISGNTDDFFKPKELYPYPYVDGKKSLSIYSEFFKIMYENFGCKDEFYDHAVLHTPYPRLPEKNCSYVGLSTEKVKHSLLWPRKIGNSYTASLYVALSSLMANKKVDIGDKILVYSFGSGSCGSLFVLTKAREGMEKDYYKIFDDRKKISAKDFVELMDIDKRLERAPMNKQVVYSGYYRKSFVKGFGVYEFIDNSDSYSAEEV